MNSFCCVVVWVVGWVVHAFLYLFTYELTGVFSNLKEKKRTWRSDGRRQMLNSANKTRNASESNALLRASSSLMAEENAAEGEGEAAACCCCCC